MLFCRAKKGQWPYICASLSLSSICMGAIYSMEGCRAPPRPHTSIQELGWGSAVGRLSVTLQPGNDPFHPHPILVWIACCIPPHMPPSAITPFIPPNLPKCGCGQWVRKSVGIIFRWPRSKLNAHLCLRNTIGTTWGREPALFS